MRASVRACPHLVSVDVGEKTKTEAVAGARVREPVNSQAGFGRVEDLSHSVLHLVVAHAAPVGRLAVRHRLVVQRRSFCMGGVPFVL